ncbi:hypothetical protein BJV74DRAFT_154799 [Russula compacta]|nr:hypothetical protein BJV74DRAFT_154799 [Russula compacta]
MVNFYDPAVYRDDSFLFLKFWNAVDGLFIWEFLITLDYEWRVIRGHRPYRWTIWIYSLSRVAALATVALDIATIDATIPISCQVRGRITRLLPYSRSLTGYLPKATIVPQFILAYLALACASLLIVLRIIAIWNMSRVVGAIAIGLWITNISFLIQGVIRFRAQYVSDEFGCELVRIDGIQLSTIVALVTDVVLLLIMLFGVFRLRRHDDGTMALGQLLWNQGIIWLILATAAEVTPVVFIYLNLNEPFDLLFQMPWMITMTIAATRMYRSLSDFGSSDMYDIPSFPSSRC